MTTKDIVQSIGVSIHDAVNHVSVVGDNAFSLVKGKVQRPLQGTVRPVESLVFDAVIDEVRVHTDPTYTDE